MIISNKVKPSWQRAGFGRVFTLHSSFADDCLPRLTRAQHRYFDAEAWPPVIKMNIT